MELNKIYECALDQRTDPPFHLATSRHIWQRVDVWGILIVYRKPSVRQHVLAAHHHQDTPLRHPPRQVHVDDERENPLSLTEAILEAHCIGSAFRRSLRVMSILSLADAFVIITESSRDDVSALSSDDSFRLNFGWQMPYS